MFKKIFSKLFPQSTPHEWVSRNSSSSHQMHPAREALISMIPEQRKTDPLFGPKMGAIHVGSDILEDFKVDGRVHFDSYLCALSSLAGYACQAAVREEFIRIKGMPENQVFTVAEGANGLKYYFGDLLNKPLAESKYSVWSVVAGAAQQAGCTNHIRIDDIFAHVAKTVGTDQFGIPHLPPEHVSADLPINYVRALWSKHHAMVKQFCPSPAEWPLLYAIAVQETIMKGQELMKTEVAVTLAMECAIPMSKADLNSYPPLSVNQMLKEPKQ